MLLQLPVAQQPVTGVLISAPAPLEMLLLSALMIPTLLASTIVSLLFSTCKDSQCQDYLSVATNQDYNSESRIHIDIKLVEAAEP
jgi:hypothetical protein